MLIRTSLVNKEQKSFHQSLIEYVGCIACRQAGLFANWATIHHIRNSTSSNGHWYVLPLCSGHHKHGEGHDSLKWYAVHPFRDNFEKRYGTQHELYIQSLSILDRFGVPLPHGLQQWINKITHKQTAKS
ncbi:Ref family recombination enhancement nuclease [Spartinivicinus poritis]|uniref:Ref family recombination enhancement nuclease n=1 Tax=Spartinivicinus poritis TaxID=2994640 RepID=A0ABT5UD46_9GAMM|nr:Ref family recombination enhancement nuclease [Spartinivicinus sp. A2-2]MDE1464302.1 Ref family recombination enhancement nuclease [Spartinivicinus sp. A2-2]